MDTVIQSSPAETTPSLRRPNQVPVAWFGVASVVGMGATWWTLASSGVVSRDLLPTPGDVLDALLEVVREGYRGTTLWGNAASTLGRLGAGFGLAVVAGVPLGL